MYTRLGIDTFFRSKSEGIKHRLTIVEDYNDGIECSYYPQTNFISEKDFLGLAENLEDIAKTLRHYDAENKKKIKED